MKRKPHWEIIRSRYAAWHVRFRSSNGRIIMSSELYSKRERAFRAIELVSGMSVDWIDGKPYAYPAKGSALEVREIDERYVPPPVVLEPPFFNGWWTDFASQGRATEANERRFWHDWEYHQRHCAEPCEEGTPPIGAEVRGRMGVAIYKGEAS